MKKKKVVFLCLAALAILCFQILYYRMTVVMLQGFANHVQGWSNDCYLMVHHFFQFIMLFIPTVLLQRYLHMDFGYHIKDWKRGLGWLGIAVGFAFLFHDSGILMSVFVSYVYDFHLFPLLFNDFNYLFSTVPVSKR